MSHSILPVVLQAEAVRPYLVNAYLNDGTVHQYDVKPLIDKGGVFAPLRDEAFFAERLTVLNETVAWDITGDRNPYTCVDIDPCAIAASPLVPQN